MRWKVIFTYSSKLCQPLKTPSVPGARQCLPASACVLQVRGAKKKFGGATRDPYRSLKKKLVMEKAQKVSKVPLVSSERRDKMVEFPVNRTSSGTIFATYTPLEKFAKAPFYTRARLRQRWTAFKEGLTTIYSGALIRMRLRKVDPFRPIELARKAQEMFINVNRAIQEKDKAALRELTTEDALEGLRKEFRAKNFKWEIVEELERPRIVSARAAPYDGKDLIAQIVLRMHTKQIMALYGSNGNVFRGHPTAPKTVIDYVVLERPLELPASKIPWRIAGKLPPQLPWKQEQVQSKALHA